MYYIEKKLSQLEAGETFRVYPSPQHAEWRVLNFRDIPQDHLFVPIMLVGEEESGHVNHQWADAEVYIEGEDRRQEDIGRWVEMRARDIPMGAEYVAYGSGPGPHQTVLTCRERDFIHVSEDATRWVHLPDRRA